MNLAIFSHKPCWPSPTSPTGFATDGGFPFQMAALSELFDSTQLLVPVSPQAPPRGEIPLRGHNLTIHPLSARRGAGLAAKIGFLPWLIWNSPTLLHALWTADAVHAPIPGDVGTAGMLGAWLLRKPLFVRHCGNWLKPATLAEKFWRRFMEAVAGGRNVMLATGGAPAPPSARNPHIRWIFSTSLTRQELNRYATPRPFPPPGQARLILVARQDPHKGADTVIRSLPLLLPQFPGVSFEIVGDGSAIPELRQLAQQTGLAERVHFAGKLTHAEVMNRLQPAHLFVFPTTASEGFPKAVLEALATGLPVVATPVSVLPQLLGTGCGVLVAESTPDALADAIAKALASPAAYEGMSRQAIATASQYSLETWRQTIGALLTPAWAPLSSP